MIVNFSNIVFDSYGKLECPTLFLKTLAGQSIQPIVNYYNLRADFKYNDVSTITFDITDRFSHDGEMKNNPAYEEICGLRIVEMEPFGQFILMQPEISDDGIRKVKSCTAYSLEYELNFKTMPPLSESEGGYQFYNTANDQSSLMHIVLSKLPNWTIGYVSPSVCTRVRNFSTSSENIYSFLMNTVQESYNCLFIFDIKERKINVYDASDDARIENIPIYISKENLINEITLSEITEDIVTCLSVYGADNISIDSVNPLGTEKLYNIDYFIENGDVPSPIAKKWNQWKSDVDIYQKLFAGVYSQLYSNLVVYNSQKIKLDELKNELDTQNTLLSSYKADTDLNSDHSQAIKECENKIASINADISEQTTIVENANAEIEKSQSMMSDITSLCKIENYFLDYEYKILVQFFKEGSIQDSTFVSTNVATTPDSCISVVPDDDFKVSITEGNLYKAEEYVWLTEDDKASASFDSETVELIDSIESEVRTYLNKNFYTIDIGNIVISNRFANDQNDDKAFHLSGTVINSTVSYDNTVLSNGRYDGVVTFTITDVVYNGEKYGTATFTAIGEISSFSHSNREENNKDTMSFSIDSGILTLTCKSTIYQKQETIQQLYDYGKACINKLAFPSYEFSINSSNFILSEQFAAFKNQVELGKSINVEFNEDLFRRPILIGVELNYEDLTDFNLTFSNKFRSNSAEFLLSDVIGKSSTAMSNLDASKFSYAAFSNSTLENDVTALMNEAFDVSKRQIVNTNNQSLLVDDAGIHLRKVANKLTGEFNPNQIRMINNKIAFTNDNWENVSLAIGEMNIGGATFMGVVADSLIGKAMIGNQLTIEANGIDPVHGNQQITTFRVDGKGAYIANGAMYMEGPITKSGERNKIALDPRYGLISGDKDLFEIGSSGVVLKNINEDGTFEVDDFGMPVNSSFFLDLNSNSAFFRGNIYAKDGYFAGKVSAGAIIERGDHNEEFPEGSIGKIEETAAAAKKDAEDAKRAAEDASKEYETLQSAVNRVSVYRQVSAPTENLKTGDIWFNTAKNNQISIYDGTSWDIAQLGLDALGNINANQVVVGGDLIAFGATIGGFNIGENALYNGTAGANNSVYLGTDGISCGKTFSVTDEGILRTEDEDGNYVELYNGSITAYNGAGSSVIYGNSIELSGRHNGNHHIKTNIGDSLMSMSSVYVNNGRVTTTEIYSFEVSEGGYSNNATLRSDVDIFGDLWIGNGEAFANGSGNLSVSGNATISGQLSVGTLEGVEHTENRTGVIKLGNMAIVFGHETITTGTSEVNGLFSGSLKVSFGVTFKKMPAIITNWSGSYGNMHSTGSSGASTTGATIWGRTTTASSERTIQWVAIGEIS